MIEKVPELLFDILTLVIIVSIVVLIYFGLRSETIISTADSTATQEFVTDAKKNGYITKDDYEKYIDRLAMTKVIYDIDFEHTYTLEEPEYRMRTLQEIIDAQKAAYTGSNIYTYVPITTEKPTVTDPVNTGTLNTETNESVLASATNSAASADHLHTDACYGGHKHKGVYGTQDLTGIPVYMSYSYNTSTYPYANTFYIICAQCNSIIYSISFTWYSNPTTSSATIYGYSETGVQSALSQCTFTSTDAIKNYIYSTLMPIYTSNGGTGTSDGGYYHYTQTNNFIWTYGNLPWVSGTTVTSIAFPGCTNIYKHPDVSGCYLQGYMGNVIVQYQFSSDSSLGTSYHYIYVKCANCGQTILEMDLGINYAHSSSWGQTFIKTFYKQFMLSGGVMSWTNYAGVTGSGPLTGHLPSSSNFAWEAMVDPVKYAFINIAQSLPFTAINYGPGGSVYGLTTMPIPYPFPYVPVLYTTDMSYNVMQVPFTGCTTCGTFGANYSCGLQSSDLDCGKIVTSISPTHSTQTAYLNDPIITTVTVTYLDGSTKVVAGTTDFSTANIVKNGTATITYSYNLYGVTYSKTCSVTVNVVPRNKTCVNGHTFNLNTDGTDPGCPYCKAWVKSIQLVNPSSIEFTIDIGTTLEENGIVLLITYLDGSTEEITSGYEDNLDMGYLGTMQVTIGYKGTTTQCRVTTVCKKMTCSICGYVYDLWPDGTDPGCPRCISKIPVFTGNVLEYTKHEDMEDILDKLYQDGIYRFNGNDTFSLSIKNKSRSAFRNLLKKFFPSLPDVWISLDKSVKIWRN